MLTLRWCRIWPPLYGNLSTNNIGEVTRVRERRELGNISPSRYFKYLAALGGRVKWRFKWNAVFLGQTGNILDMFEAVKWKRKK